MRRVLGEIKENLPLSEEQQRESAVGTLDNTTVSRASLLNLKEQLYGALKREREMKSILMSLCGKEALYIGDRLKSADQAIAAIKPEVEKWIMRNEELEGKLADSL